MLKLQKGILFALVKEKETDDHGAAAATASALAQLDALKKSQFEASSASS